MRISATFENCAHFESSLQQRISQATSGVATTQNGRLLDFHVDWRTKNDSIGNMDIDFTQASIRKNIQDALSEDPSVASQGCRTLGFIATYNRTDAMVFLLGLLSYHRGELKRLEAVVDALGSCVTPIVATVLFEEIRRLESSNTTRTYLNLLIKILARFPKEMVEDQFEDLASDSSFSPKMRSKFRQIAESYHPY